MKFFYLILAGTAVSLMLNAGPGSAAPAPGKPAAPSESGGRIQYPAPETRLEEPISERHADSPGVRFLKERFQNTSIKEQFPPDYRKVMMLIYMQGHASPALDLLRKAIDSKDLPLVRETTAHLHLVYSRLQRSPFANHAKWWTISQQGKSAAVTVRLLSERGDNPRLVEETFAKVVESCYACHRAYGGPTKNYEELVRFKIPLEELGPVPEVPKVPPKK